MLAEQIPGLVAAASQAQQVEKAPRGRPQLTDTDTMCNDTTVTLITGLENQSFLRFCFNSEQSVYILFCTKNK